MQDEKIYFEDDDYIISSKRIVIRKRGETYSINSVSDPRFEQSPCEYVPTGEPWDLIGNLTGRLYAQVFGYNSNKWIGHLRVIVKIQGKEQVFADEAYYDFGATDPWRRPRGGTEEFEVRLAYFRNLAIAIGAAITGA